MSPPPVTPYSPSPNDPPSKPLSLASLLEELDLAERPPRDHRPDWVAEFIDCVADLFEPLKGSARVGYDCRAESGRWTIDVFLGSVEQIGGPQDGRREVPAFRFDLRALFKCFDRIDKCEWVAAPTGESYPDKDMTPMPAGFSQLLLDGTVEGEPVRMGVSALPPEDMSLGLKVFHDGETAAV